MKPFSWIVVIIFVFLSLFLFLQSYLLADEIYLKNGDKITGNITGETESSISVETEAIGVVTVNRTFVSRIVRIGEIKEAISDPEEEKLWQREISMGYSNISGNTESSQLSIGLGGSKKTDHDETTFKGNIYYSSSNDKMNSQKWYGMGRYAYSFKESKKWYNFYKLEIDHDRFTSINYRVMPSLGWGYWFSDEPDLRAMAEVGLGWERTDFRNSTKDSDEIALLPRAFFEKKLFSESRISQDLTFYPYLSDAGEFRLRSETKLINPINEKLALSLSLIDDYNSNPAKNTKKNDLQIISALTYSF